MKIKFKKGYPDDTTWTEVVMDFLEVLSKEYGYTLDEFDMLKMPSGVRLDRLGKLLNDNPESETFRTAFRAAAREHLFQHEYVNERRRKAAEVAKAMTPSSMDKVAKVSSRTEKLMEEVTDDEFDQLLNSEETKQNRPLAAETEE